ncbi:MAG TPA: HAD-IC family P-type ATPase, partial [Pseudomonadales bacterium]|nr:HAD-IC family P-type ATPase [Pseudomonadales bacterium]
MHLHALPIDEALARLNTTAEGLSEAEAARRLASFGVNEMEASAREPLWRGAARQVTHFFALILWLAAALAFVAEHYQPGQGMATLGAAILGVIVINGAFSFWQEYRAERALDALQRLLPHAVRVQRAGVVRLAPARELVPGDVVLLGAGDQVPADCRVLEAYAARVNTATVTGEALPMTVSAEPSTAAEALHARNLLLAGTALVAGEARAVVFATGMHSEFGRIAQLTQATSKGLSPLQQEITRLSRWVAALAVALGVTFFVIGQALGLPLWGNVLFAIGIIVANVPEGLLPTVTLSLAMATQRMARRNALVRHLAAVETLGSTTVICSDKTGTLTQNRMSVKRVFADGDFRDVHGHLPEALLRVAARCHTLRFPGGRPEGDPMEVALWQLAAARGAAEPNRTWVREIPFEAERRRMSVVDATRPGESSGLHCKGAPETVLPLC